MRRIWFIMTLLIPVLSFSQKGNEDIYELNLDQLSKLNISSASKVVQKISEIPAIVIVITKEQIRDNGYFTLEEALSDLPGFQFRNILGINSYVFQRGIPNQNNLTLLLIDGVQINELNSGGFYGGGQYNLSNVERIEVVYGPSSVAYGTNALTGIINIITKSPESRSAEINALYGSYNTLKGDAAYSYINENKSFGVIASGMIKTSQKADLIGAAGDNNWTGTMDNFEDDYSFDLKALFKDFTFGTNYLYKKSSTATSERSAGTQFRDFGTSWNIQFINCYLKYNKALSERLTISSVLYNRNSTVLNNTIYRIVDTAQVGYYRPGNLTGLESVMNYSFTSAFTITSGVTLEYESLSVNPSLSYSNSSDLKPPVPGKPEMVSNTLASIFIEPRLNLIQNLYLSGGVRFDNSSVYNQVLTPGVGIVYGFRNYLMRASYSEAFRAPKPWDYTDGAGNISLLPEEINSFETSASVLIAGSIKIDATGYKNSLKNAIVSEILPGGYRWINKGEINTDGIELSLNYTTGKYSSYVNYSFNNSYDELGNAVTEISKHCANARVTYSFEKHIRISLRSNYSGRKENPEIISTTGSKYVDPSLIFNGVISFVNYRNLSLQLAVKNILNSEYYHTSNREPDRYRQPQRTFMFSLRYALSNTKQQR